MWHLHLCSQEVQSVFGAYKILVNYRHLSLLADYMTCEGTYKGFNRAAISSNPSPLQKITFETSMNFLVNSCTSAKPDHLRSPTARIVAGQVVSSGTGSFEIVQPLQVWSWQDRVLETEAMVGQSFETESNLSRFHHGSVVQPQHHRRTESFRQESNLQVWSSAMAGQSPLDVVQPKFEHGRKGSFNMVQLKFEHGRKGSTLSTFDGGRTCNLLKVVESFVTMGPVWWWTCRSVAIFLADHWRPWSIDKAGQFCLRYPAWLGLILDGLQFMPLWLDTSRYLQKVCVGPNVKPARWLWNRKLRTITCSNMCARVVVWLSVQKICMCMTGLNHKCVN